MPMAVQKPTNKAMMMGRYCISILPLEGGIVPTENLAQLFRKSLRMKMAERMISTVVSPS